MTDDKSKAIPQMALGTHPSLVPAAAGSFLILPGSRLATAVVTSHHEI
ncbi:MAG: hypothetical protein WAK31_20230 [Chthoniobacterales bacterium]